MTPLDKIKKISASLLLLAFLPNIALAQKVLHHDMKIIVKPNQARLEVEDTITFPYPRYPVNFLLNEKLKIISSNKKMKKTPVTTILKEFATNAKVSTNHFSMSRSEEVGTLTLRYKGKIAHPINKSSAEYSRSFSETPGLIDARGVFLASSTFWYPQFDNELVSFSMRVTMPKGWIAVSQGKRIDTTDKRGKTIVQWQELNPQDDIYLVAGKYKEYEQTIALAKARVYLRKDDSALAQKYLATTAQYLSMYNKLLGPYPYAKFALVENFWDTGYGMPSFTLLGPRVIRFPFILHSSYPHEILHNWWGNGVFVDYQQGNWAEGLTAYLADHLIKEQRGKGAEYRRSVLQKYTDFVDESRDFPITEFRSRHSSSSEAIGYGKTLMFFHMLRLKLGDGVFTRALRRFYSNQKFKITSIHDLKKSFIKTTDIDLNDEFAQWIDRTGAPSLMIKKVKTKRQPLGYRIDIDLQQTQVGPEYSIEVPVSVAMQGEKIFFQQRLKMVRKNQSFVLYVPAEPIKINVDPEFDVFRRLDSREVPAALSQGFGAAKVLVLIPSTSEPGLRTAYKTLAESWKKSQEGEWVIKLDSEVESLPADKAIWLLGWDNLHQDIAHSQLASLNVGISSKQVTIGIGQFQREQHAVLLSARNPKNPKQTILWLATDNKAALPGLTRKLPHYRKYSYLAFDGDEPKNIAKGQWSITDSPLSFKFKNNKKIAGISMPTKLKARQPLAQLPPIFSRQRMMKDIAYLAGKDLKGRGLGTNELDEAARYIASIYRDAGLKPIDKNQGGYFQEWTEDLGESKGKLVLKNVIGILPGSNKKLSKESVIIAAHYDHLGTGWPDVRKGNKGKIHYGADDNASGVAVLLELARQVAKKWKPQRSILFIAFSGEEADRRGSRYFVEHGLKNYPINKVMSMVNLDTIGRLGANPITVFGAGSATEWVHIFRGVGFVTGAKIKTVPNEFGSSDQKSFLDRGIPAVQIFGSAHKDFHRPTDTIDKIDSAGLVKVAMVLKETIEFLANRDTSLTVTLKTGKNDKKQKSSFRKNGRKASLGTVPNFTYTGKGVRISGVIPGSPAEAVGLKDGDILLKLHGVDLPDLPAYARLLKELNPGDNAELVYQRNGKRYTVDVVIKER